MQSKEELVNLATINFQNKNYEECINNLNELLKSNSNDPKILHNLAVAEYYYKQEKKQKEALRELLQKTIQENKTVIDENKLDIIQILNEESDPFNNFKLNGFLNNQKDKENETENSSPNQDDSEKSLDKESLNEPDLDLAENQDDTELDPSKLPNLPTVLSDISYELYNTAIMYYKEKKFNEAIELLEPSFSNVEALDDYIALKICFLLMDLYLEINDSKKALAILEISQKIYNRNVEETKSIDNEDGDSSINSSLKDIDQSSSKSDLDKNDKVSNDTNDILLTSSSMSSLKNLNDISPDIKLALPSKFNTFNAFYYYQKSRINIKNKEMEEAKKNLELSLRSNKTESIINEQSPSDDSMVAADFMNANEENNKNKKDINDNQENYYQLENVVNNLNATSAYNNDNLNESFKILSSQSHGEDYVYNNLGCISYREKKYTLAENYFLKALKENEELIKNQQNQPENENDTDEPKRIKKLPSILHNLELQYMVHSDFEMAIKCLINDRRLDKEDTISLENIFYWLRAGENFLRIYKEKAYSTDPKNVMKVYRISPEIAYGFINNKSRSISLLGDNSEFEELNKITNFSDYQIPEKIPENAKELLVHSFKCFQKTITLIEKLRLDSLSLDGLSINNSTNPDDPNSEKTTKPSQSLFTDNELKILMDILKLNVAYIYLEYKQYDLVLTMLNDFLLIDINDIKKAEQNEEIYKVLGISPLTLNIIAKIYISQALVGFKLFNEAYSMISTNVIPNDTSVDPHIRAILYLCQASILCWSVYGQQDVQEKILLEAEQSLQRFYILAYSYLKNTPDAFAGENENPLPITELDTIAMSMKNKGPRNSAFVLNAQLFISDAKMIQTWIDMKRKDYESALKHLS
ncbi:TPR-like protein [Neocallimastix californiae]|jgi:tetratricopeptide (TPR) repeat protein|uniref:TPR-like protein n=1 Tax=Neocallimastix californiae TaxID=1754190 RepID=A0A1Y2AFU6_9FUNG|nr:TPR-like protein [Neocallimastix californiae]|eukprot:ORY21488.1 TPR-like protein [Neocallimastix californiae]